MDANRRMTLNDRKGMALVFVAIIIFGICVFLGLAIDIGYMYVAKGQLQNAADSAALAGAAKLDGTAFTTQTSARNTAKKFAEVNPVVPGPDTKVLVAAEDVMVGNWNPTRPSAPVDQRFQQDVPPINAVKVMARRMEGAPGGPVDLFFSRAVGWYQMETSATAVAQRAPKADFYFVLGKSACNTTTFPFTLVSGSSSNMAWSSLLEQVTSSSGVQDELLCPADKQPHVEVCNQSIYTTGGSSGSDFKAAETDFYDPGYDASNKTFGLYKGKPIVTSWKIVVPVSYENDPAVQPAPLPVWGYAKIRLTRICGTGGVTGCKGRDFTAPNGICSPGEQDMVIDQIECVSCDSSSNLLGSRPSLVQ